MGTKCLVRKKFGAEIDAAPPETGESGQFTALVSAFGVLDSQGDVIDKGAFANAIEAFEGGRKLPVVWSHNYDDPTAIIGEVTDMVETDAGLLVEAVLDVDDNELAAHIHRQMVKGRLTEFSIGGEVVGWELKQTEDGAGGDGEFHITDLSLWEVGPCFKGANPATELVSVKSLLAKEGRVLAQRHVEALRELYEQLGTVLAAVEPAPKDEEHDGGAQAVEEKSSGGRQSTKNRAALRLMSIEGM